VAKAIARRRGFSLMESKSRAMRGLLLNGKSFGMSSHGRLILKMNEARATALIAAGIAKPFAPSPGKVMKGWLEVTHPKADWVALAKEALALAAAAGIEPPARKSARVKKGAKSGRRGK
jgi:TfoX/Sxy family transcriptional regulator of competence genes